MTVDHPTAVSNLPIGMASPRTAPQFEFEDWLAKWQPQCLYYRADRTGNLTYVSPSVRHLLGYQPKEMLGRNWQDFACKSLPAREEAPLASDKAFHCFKMKLTAADGGERIVEFQECALLDPDNKQTAWEGIGKDVTDAAQTSEELEVLKDRLEQLVAQRTSELRESENRYRNVVEDQTEFIVRWLPDGTCTFVNEAYCRYFGRSRESVIGSVYIPWIVETDRSEVAQAIASLTSERPSSTTEHQVYRADGTIGWNLWTNRALFDKDGRLVEYQSVGCDVTKLKEAADTIREKEAHLAHVSRLATLGELVAGIAHEIHQPLHAANTFAEAARRSLESGLPDAVPTAIECANEISTAVGRAAKIIRHLRKFSEPHPAQLVPVDINEVVHEALRIMAYETVREQVTQQLDLAEGLPQIQGDSIQLEQLCINLIKNAYDSMDTSPERLLQVSTHREACGIIVSICDSGCGVEGAEAARLFDAFYTTKPSGMGVGLSLCKSIAEAHGATLSCEPNDGAGMTFKLILPLSTTTTPASEKENHE